MAIIPPLAFQAKWEPENIHLKAANPTCTRKIASAVYNFFSFLTIPIAIARAIGWVIGQLAKKCILPSAWFYPHQIIRLTQNAFNAFCFGPINPLNQRFHALFIPEKHEVVTPDGALLDVTVFRHRQAGPDTPIVLFIQSNASFSQQAVYTWLMEQAMDRGSICHFVVFDYRGVSNSEGDAKQLNDLILDADSVYQFIRDRFSPAGHFPPELIKLYGWSLGAGVGARLKEHRPEINGPFVNERSFSSIQEVVDQTIPLYLKPFLFWIPWCFAKQGWDLSVNPSKIQGPILAIKHEQDPIIPDVASFIHSAQKAEIDFASIDLVAEPRLQAAEKRQYVDHHFTPLARYLVKGQNEIRADHAVADFILPPAADAEEGAV